MFDALSEKLETTFRKLRNRGKLSEPDIDEALKDIRLALLEADVHFRVTKEFCENIRKKALGTAVLKSLSPGQMVIKYVHEELVEALGKHESINFRHPPPLVIMLIGLQGSGKTTSCGKLARYLRDDMRRRPLLVPADVYRPAAIEQLKSLGKSLKIEVFDVSPSDDPTQIAKRALDFATKAGFDTVILDTAGRLQIDNELMNELADIVEAVDPHEILLVCDAMTGQVAVEVAQGFNERVEIDGIILTKLDGDARGGAALSMRSVIHKPIKFVGIGEKLDALEPFYPDRLASRILGMGDVLSLIEKASKQVTIEDSKKLQKKLKKNEFTLQDFHSQLQTIKNMGPVGSLMQMVPGMGKAMRGLDESLADKELKRVEAMILSMTPQERENYQIIDGSRRRRIAQGSGTKVEDINLFLKQFVEMKKVMKHMAKLGPQGLSGLTNMLRGGAKLPR